ncbi:MAG: hypothetical protein V2B19_10990 [Pseudomonadota bacterium]
MRLQDNTLWPIPVCLDATETVARRLEAGQSLALRDPEGFLPAILHVEDLWPVDHKKEAFQVYGTDDTDHKQIRMIPEEFVSITKLQGDHGRFDGKRVSAYSQPTPTPALSHFPTSALPNFRSSALRLFCSQFTALNTVHSSRPLRPAFTVLKNGDPWNVCSDNSACWHGRPPMENTKFQIGALWMVINCCKISTV